MRVFPTEDEAAVRQRLAAFIREMDELGEAYGTPGSGDAAGVPKRLTRGGGVVESPDDQFVWLIVGGSAWFRGGDGTRVLVEAGNGVFWEAGESWSVEVENEPLLYFDIDGPALTIEHFA